MNASLIAPTLVGILVLLLEAPTRRGAGAVEVAGLVFIGAYLVMLSVAYTSQLTLLPRLLEEQSAWAELGYFGQPRSVPYLLALLGYGMFGVGGSLLSLRFLGAGETWTWLGATLLASGVASVVGFVGYATRNRLVEAGNIVGGVLIVPFAVLVAVSSKGL